MYINNGERGKSMEYKGRYLVNARTFRIHDVLNRTKGCKLEKIQQINAIFFDTLEEAEKYPNEITPRTVKCKYCFKNL